MNTLPISKSSASDVIGRAKDAVHEAEAAAKDALHSASENCKDTITRTEAYVRENPAPAFIGAFILGAALGLVLAGHRHEPSFRERIVDDPLDAIRDTIFAALAPVGKRLRESYDSARESAEDFVEHAQDNASRHADSWGKQLRRASHNLKFW